MCFNNLILLDPRGVGEWVCIICYEQETIIIWNVKDGLQYCHLYLIYIVHTY